MKEQVTELDWGFALQWLLASAAGTSVGGALAFFTMWRTAEAVTVVVGEIAAGFVAGVLFGLFFGGGANAGPALLLRGKGISSVGWLGASALAAALSAGTAIALTTTYLETMSDPATAIVIALVLGLPMGLVQWLLLRRHDLAAGEWPVISLAAYSLASILITSGNEFGSFLITIAVIGLLVGAVTGLGMMWVLRRQTEPVLS